MIALDASALLAVLFAEPGHERVAPHLSRCCICTVNLAEVAGRFARDGHDAEAVVARIRESTVEIVPFTARHAALAASLLPATRELGLSLGDRACLALALHRGIAALTADRAWSSLRVGVRVEVIR